MASGEGSRLRALSKQLGLPKHLFPIGDSSIAKMTAIELSRSCDQVVCIPNPEYSEQFKKAFSDLDFPIEITPKLEDGFHGDFSAAYQAAKYEQVILTVGDLIFPTEEIGKFITKAQKHPDKIILALDSTALFTRRLDFRMIIAAIPKAEMTNLINLDPENFWAVVKRIFKLLLKNKIRITFLKTLFNINTPESYQAAQEYFKKN